MKLSSFTCLGFMTNAVFDTCPNFKLSIAEVREAAQAGILVEHLAERFGERADFSLILSNQAELTEVDLALADAAKALDGGELRKAGVSKRGLCFVVAIILEAIQRKFISLTPPQPT